VCPDMSVQTQSMAPYPHAGADVATQPHDPVSTPSIPPPQINGIVMVDLYQLPCPCCHVLVGLSYSTFSIQDPLSWLPCPGNLVQGPCTNCPVLAVLSWLSCLICPDSSVLYQLSYINCPARLSYPSSRLSCLGWAAPALMSSLSCNGCQPSHSILAVLYWLSCSCCPVLAFLGSRISSIFASNNL
jgi:hypothetical protein